METIFIKYLISFIAIIIVVKIFIVVFKKVRKKRILKENRKLLESVTQLYRGTDSEKDLVLKLLKYKIHPKAIFHDLYIKKGDSNFSQIDLVVATKVGILVIEVKDYSGWIFGTGYKSKWTQVLAYGKQKYRFYNPILQNNKHINELKKQLRENVPFYSLVVFYGNCKLKDISFVPKATFVLKSERILEVMNIIMKENEPVEYTNKKRVVKVLSESVKNGESEIIQKQHVKKIKDMLGEDRVFDK